MGISLIVSFDYQNVYSDSYCYYLNTGTNSKLKQAKKDEATDLGSKLIEIICIQIAYTLKLVYNLLHI